MKAGNQEVLEMVRLDVRIIRGVVIHIIERPLVTRDAVRRKDGLADLSPCVIIAALAGADAFVSSWAILAQIQGAVAYTMAKATEESRTTVRQPLPPQAHTKCKFDVRNLEGS